MPRRTPLSLELLETFLCVVQSQGDAATAAKQLGINQPSMSKRLKSLQHAGSPLKHPWLQRIGKTWRLTAEGQRVLPAVRELLQRHQQLSSFVEAGDEVRVHFACGQWSASPAVARTLQAFRAQYPDLPVRVSSLRGGQRIEGVATGTLDFAVVSHDPVQIAEIARRPLATEALTSEPFCLACSRETSWASQIRRLRKSGLTPEKLTAIPLIVPEPDASVRQRLDEWLNRIVSDDTDSTSSVALETGGWATILSHVRAGLGAGILPRGFVQGTSDLEAVEFDTDTLPGLTMWLICRPSAMAESGLDLSAPAQVMYELLRQNYSR